jgi:quinol monooxygenase YgiN
MGVKKWQSQEDIDADVASSHQADVITAAGDHFDGFPAIHPLARWNRNDQD